MSEGVLQFGSRDFVNSEILDENLGYQAFKSLAKQPLRIVITDYSGEVKQPVRACFVLAFSYLLAKKIRKEFVDEARIGIILPPGIGATIANLAVVIAGKSPVNLNFTLGSNTLDSCIRTAGIKTTISADSMREKFKQIPWTSGFLDISSYLKGISKLKLLSLAALLAIAPVKQLMKWLKLPQEGGDREAAILFTSGSSGEPKGAILSHKNIMANIAQIKSIDLITPKDKLLSCLPIFHSFGFTVNLWYPLLAGVSVVSTVSPLDVKKNAKVISEEAVTIFASTPSFLKPFLKVVNPEDIRSLKAVIAGAEKTPATLKANWEKLFSSLYLEGYGLTETAPVVGVNLPICPKTGARRDCEGSIGVPLAGMSARIVHPETEEVLSPYEQGVLQIKGPNIFGGYLDNEQETQKVFRDEWLHTGDVARFNEDGFLFIEGRMSRFSKIAGEMVPHITIEEAIKVILGLEDEEKPSIVVLNQKHPTKGEMLTVLSTQEMTTAFISMHLRERGFPNLWIPKNIVQTDFIPFLPSGKLDLKACERLLEQFQK